MGDHHERPVTGYPATAAPPPNANGYAATGTAYPYVAQPPPPYYNNNYYQTQPYYAAQRTTFLRRVIAIIIASFVITGTIIFIIWLVIRPRLPEFRVDSLSVSNLNLSKSLITANWDLQFTVRNPNKKITLDYDDVAAAIFYDSLSLSDTTIPPFYQGKGNETTQKGTFATSSSYVESWAFDGMNKERAQSGTIGFNLRMVARVRFKAGAWRARRRFVRVFCGSLSVGVAANKSSGNLLGGARECRVGL